MNVFLWKNYGQLGNRLLTFSHLLALAKENSWVVHHLTFGAYQRHFRHFAEPVWGIWPRYRDEVRFTQICHSRAVYKIMCRVLSSRRCLTILRKAKRIYEQEDSYEVTPERFCSHAFQSSGSWVVWTAWNLHFNDLRNQHREHVREALRPVKSIEDHINQVVCQASADTLRVGIHVRRGDYAQWLGGRYFYDHDRYRRLMDLVCSEMAPRKVHFFVASNESIPVGLTTGLSASVLQGNEAEDLYALSACDLIVGPPSTYTEWAAFYSGASRLIMDDASDEGLSRAIHTISNEMRHLQN